MLEKGYNKKSSGHLFQDYNECKFYQSQFGGVIHSIQQMKGIEEVEKNIIMD
jgi:hypothetical protein